MRLGGFPTSRDLTRVDHEDEYAEERLEMGGEEQRVAWSTQSHRIIPNSSSDTSHVAETHILTSLCLSPGDQRGELSLCRPESSRTDFQSVCDSPSRKNFKPADCSFVLETKWAWQWVAAAAGAESVAGFSLHSQPCCKPL